MSWAVAQNGGVLLRLQIQPKASKTEIVGLHGDRLKVRVNAPPADGEANEELLRFLKKKLGAPVELVRGHTSRSKDVFCAGISLEKARELTN